MIDDSLLKNYNIGKDGFSWWLGQVCEAETWADNYPCMPVDYLDDLPGFKRRVKVSILGWHTTSKDDIKNHELPWAYCLLPVTAGGGVGGSSESYSVIVMGPPRFLLIPSVGFFLHLLVQYNYEGLQHF